MALRTDEKAKLIKEFALNPKDTGSLEVQVALLTSNIRELTEHCKSNPKDFSSKRGLLKMVNQRKRFLKHLEEHDTQKYKQIIERLGLRK